jgi:hypothetical protein
MLADTVACLSTLRASWRKQPEAIQTTLYDLIAMMQNGVGPEDDALIVATLTELIRTERIRFLSGIGAKRAGC